MEKFLRNSFERIGTFLITLLSVGKKKFMVVEFVVNICVRTGKSFLTLV